MKHINCNYNCMTALAFGKLCIRTYEKKIHVQWSAYELNCTPLLSVGVKTKVKVSWLAFIH